MTVKREDVQSRSDLLQQAIEIERNERSDGQWAGNERRSIPIHILTYVDERLTVHTQHIEAIFKDHTEDEMDRYSAILTRIDDSQKASEERHAEVMLQMSGWNSKCEDVTSAFLKTPEGKPDFAGHHYDHSKRKRIADWWQRTRENGFAKIVEWANDGRDLVASAFDLGSAVERAG